MQGWFQDSMAIVCAYGRPHLFLTFTANPRWPEILRELKASQQTTDRPDLMARVFQAKIRELLREVRNGLFGKYNAHIYTIEYQKRGLPHMHLLIWLKVLVDYFTADIVDELICAELPDRS
jgi:Helitron helicase-like domain at N-terminus